MKFVVFLVLLVDASLSALQRRIYNGREANKNEFPYLVSIRAAGTTCGGALLDGGFVLTAGHCLMHLDEGQQIFVSLGSREFYTYEKEPQRVIHKGDMKFWIHENFSMPSAQNDLALIRLPVHSISKSIQPIKISSDKEIDERGEEVIALAAGWGEMETGEPADVLQTTKMKLIPISDCLKYQEHYTENITVNHICAFGLHNQPNRVSGPCDGDSGSPLISAKTSELIGITSYVKDADDGKPLRSNACDSSKAPAVYVRVASYLDWISEKTGLRFD